MQTTTITALLIALAIVLALEVILKAIYLRDFNRAIVRMDEALEEMSSERELINEGLVESEPCGYMIEKDFPDLRYAVYVFKKDGSQILVKSFYYNEDDDDDREYALRCAEELLDNLNDEP